MVARHTPEACTPDTFRSMSIGRRLIRPLFYLWALPTSAIGLLAFLLGSLAGARATWREGVLEVNGPGIRKLFAILPAPIKIQAMALGHVVLACDQECLDRTRAHERVHVRQAERWGPLFLPAYFIASLSCWLRGRDVYHDNPFEREACDS